MIRAKVVVDATGQAGLLGARFGLRQPRPEFRKAAIWGHFRGSRRDVIEGGVMTVCFRTLSNRSWFWHIPLSNDVVSIGVVGDADYFFGKGAGTPDEIFAREVADCPAMAQRLAGTEKVAGLDVVKEYSYATGQIVRRRLGARGRLVGLHRSDLFLRRVVRAQERPARRRRDHRRLAERMTRPAHSSANGCPISPAAPRGSASWPRPGTAANSASANSSASIRTTSAP